MLTTTRRGISYPNPDRSDRPDIPTHIANAAQAADTAVIYDQGTNAARLAASHTPSGGRYWWETDNHLMYYDDGTTWWSVSPGTLIGTLGAIPVATTVPVGTKYLATDDRGGTFYISNGTVWLQAAGSVQLRRGKATRSTAQSIPNITDTVVTFDTEEYDTNAMVNIGTNATRITIVNAGVYLVGANGFLAASGNDSYIYVRSNGTTKLFGSSIGPPNGGCSAVSSITFAANDYVELVVHHNQGSAQNFTGAALWAHQLV